jgi:hypothetical protein
MLREQPILGLGDFHGRGLLINFQPPGKLRKKARVEVREVLLQGA